MESYCAFLELPRELRDFIYEYAAIAESPFLIKKTLRPRDRRHIAARSGLLLANRQIFDEYTSIIQKVALWQGTNIEVFIRDFNFKPLEKFMLALSASDREIANTPTKLRARLLISSIYNVDLENMGRWSRFASRASVNIKYDVDDAKSGHLYPMIPPSLADIYPFERNGRDGDEATKVYNALCEWRDRCLCRRYRLVVSTGGSQVSVYLRWSPSAQAFAQFSPNNDDDEDPTAEWWTLQVEDGVGSHFGQMIAFQKGLD